MELVTLEGLNSTDSSFAIPSTVMVVGGLAVTAGVYYGIYRLIKLGIEKSGKTKRTTKKKK